MEVIYIAEPIISTSTNKLIAVEVLSRFRSKDGVALPTQRVLGMFTNKMKINLLKSQLNTIMKYKYFLKRYNILCSINVDYDTCIYIYGNKQIQELIRNNKFIALEISENYPDLSDVDYVIPFLFTLTDYIWLDDFGCGNTTMKTLIKNKYHAIKLDKSFFQEHMIKPHFEVIISNLKKLCPNIIAEGVEDIDCHKLSKGIGLWGAQGYFFPSIPLTEIESIDSEWLSDL
ncbi:TPA: EAL domain-containing protein [Escherichia coli]|nr:EAL domain-containing protein [Escherichia coli]HEC9414372.1 EAL domain-containing protein [Salmonella enterica subsp. enterica serovar Poona]HAO0383547.1 EAL domain-containing protein [Escherichia coli]HDB9600553.1 EAL domain-containing protein [Escherichia coli]HDB9799788.1 EAL domain-containing protein [Escherichia coli]